MLHHWSEDELKKALEKAELSRYVRNVVGHIFVFESLPQEKAHPYIFSGTIVAVRLLRGHLILLGAPGPFSQNVILTPREKGKWHLAEPNFGLSAVNERINCRGKLTIKS